MKIVVTGSLGHISKPLTIELLQKGHAVTVISSSASRQAEIEALGATAAIGTMQDVGFLAQTFTGADIVYLMESTGEGSFFDHSVDIVEAVTQIGRNYKAAVLQAGVTQVVHLSSIGAHTSRGIGMLVFHYNVEQILNELPAAVAIKCMRPVGFYYNMFAFIHSIKTQHAIFQNYGGDVKEPWVATEDIAAVIAEEMELPFSGRSIRYIASDEISPNEIAHALGKAIGRPELVWTEITDAQFLNGMIKAGMNPNTAKGLMEMNAGRRNNVLYEDYYNNRPVLSPTKLSAFANDFAVIYKQQ